MKYRNILEPDNLIHTFFEEPPKEFTPQLIKINEKEIPSFYLKFDISTTLNGTIKKLLEKINRILPKPKTLFIGTTVSEYSLFPEGIEISDMVKTIMLKFKELKGSLLIIKDLPMESTLLSDSENVYSKQLMSYLVKNKFVDLYGEALAYVPLNFSSIDEYLQRFSRVRRKDFKKKIRSLSEINIDQIRTGDEYFTDRNIENLYNLYFNVYQNSYVHFDLLTYNFFRKVFQDKDNNGIVFLYRHQDKIIGFNLCFIIGDKMVDKYVGFLYPDAQTFNLYYASWFYNLDFCIKNDIKYYIAGWTDPEIKAYLGAEFTYTFHAVFIDNFILRFILKKLKFLFESDRRLLEAKLKE